MAEGLEKNVKDKKADIGKEKLKAEEATFKKEESEAYELVRLRNLFYRDNYRRLVILLMILLIIIGILTVTLYYLMTHRPQPQYFATNINGGIIPLVPLDKPSVGTAELVNWVSRAVSNAFTFNYVQYIQQLEDVKDTYFTPTGAEEYMQALTSGVVPLLSLVTKNKLIMTAAPMAAPNIIAHKTITQGQYAQRYAWKVNVPVLITMQNLNNIRQYKYDVTLLVVRSSLLVDDTAKNMDGARGIGIVQMIAKSAGVISGAPK